MNLFTFSCKSKFCPSCSKIYTENWVSSLVSHIYMTFSLLTGFIRNFFFNNLQLLKNLSDGTYYSFKYSFKKIDI
ncbi:transposase zinc-binding domain-containing protein [Fusobacterium perfoetens]|uniref:transposase zinc-binding domain-containing protein n=1 Tax=Fusobacterium TaxID=848 RepID=UPI00350E52E6